ncbi:hypothetical protein A9179_01860 [Pseudomonas alcaligenes]|uniref:Pyrroloquinoline quinone biosynthesis protein PqqE n=1 Tax=Aquipseudomonas alcaligenes TaxID=43263 RepID=A0ABR7RUX9_AQUAC|nr:hypothetical protein [Pseudomonas alcaligenes]MBC9249012.1 hypothetical protein [Pseudomonas alcaligenes]
MEITASAFNSGLNAIQAGQRRVDQAAGEIAGAAVTPQEPSEAAQAPAFGRDVQADLAQSLVALQVGKVEAQAGAKVVETADEVLGTLIDTRA